MGLPKRLNFRHSCPKGQGHDRGRESKYSLRVLCYGACKADKCAFLHDHANKYKGPKPAPQRHDGPTAQWKHWLSRTQEIQVTPPDCSLQVPALEMLTPGAGLSPTPYRSNARQYFLPLMLFRPVTLNPGDL